MAWQIKLTSVVEKQLSKLDAQIHKRILNFLDKRLAKLEDPRSIGEPLRGSTFGELWRYRVGDYRLISYVDDSKIEILIVRIGHRREVYEDHET